MEQNELSLTDGPQGIWSLDDQAEEEGEKVDVIQVIGLELTGEQFVIDILNVSEIVRFEELEITRVPHGHYYILGVINLRGKVVPVVDLATRLGLATDRQQWTRMIVVEIGQQVVGFTVDAVSEVLHLPATAIESTTREEEYVVGIATVDDQIMTMLDLEKTLVTDPVEETA